MTDELVIGLIIADEMEFEPFCETAKKRAAVEKGYLFDTLSDYFDDNRICECSFEGESSPEGDGCVFRIAAVRCGIGKVNAAFAASVL